MGDSRVKDVSSLLSAFFDEDKLRRGERFSSFFSSWTDIVGPRLAAHSRVADVDKGMLVVEAEHPGWIQLLQLRQSSILESVSQRYPDLALRGIVFRLASSQSGERRPKAITPAMEREEAHLEAKASAVSEFAESPGALPRDPAVTAMFEGLKKAMRE